MEEEIRKRVATFFSCFYNISQKWKEYNERLDRPVTGLKNQIEQLLVLERVENVAELENKSHEIRESLVFKIMCGIELELRIIHTILNELNKSVQDLKNKLNHLEVYTSSIDWDNPNLVIGSATHPPLSDLMQMAFDGYRIYYEMYQNFANSVKSVDLRNDRTVKKININLSANDEKKVNEVIAFTQYCYTDTD